MELKFFEPVKKVKRNENLINNLRLLFMKLYDDGMVENLHEFALICQTPETTVTGWLEYGRTPNMESIRRVELALQLADGSLTNEEHPMIKNWLDEYNRRTCAKPSLRKIKRYVIPDDEPRQMVAESEFVYGKK